MRPGRVLAVLRLALGVTLGVPARIICHNICQMQSLGRQTSSLVEHLEVSDFARWLVLSWPLGLTFKRERYKLPE